VQRRGGRRNRVPFAVCRQKGEREGINLVPLRGEGDDHVDGRGADNAKGERGKKELLRNQLSLGEKILIIGERGGKLDLSRGGQ